MEKDSNVLQFKPKSTLFSGELRKKLEAGLEPTVGEEKTSLTINQTEQIICTFIVQKAFEFGKKIGDILGNKVTGGIDNVQNR